MATAHLSTDSETHPTPGDRPSPCGANNPHNAKQPIDGDSNAASVSASQQQELGGCIFWGLYAVKAATKKRHASQECARMLEEYVVERFVLFSKECPLEVGRLAAEVRNFSFYTVLCWRTIYGVFLRGPVKHCIWVERPHTPTPLILPSKQLAA